MQAQGGPSRAELWESTIAPFQIHVSLKKPVQTSNWANEQLPNAIVIGSISP